MAVALALSLLAALVREAGAARQLARGSSLEAAGAATGSGWLKSSKRFCISSEAVLSCDEHSIIQVVSAFYANLPQVEGSACAPRAGAGRAACEANATGGVDGLCRGRRRCAVPPSSHPSCATITAIRIVWGCVAGSPETAEADLQPVQPGKVEKPLLGGEVEPREDGPVVAGKVERPRAGGKLEPREGEEDEEDEFMRGDEVAQKLDAEALKPKGEGGEDEEDELVRGDVAPQKMAELDSEASRLREDAGLEVSFEPCFRIWGWMGPLRRINLWGNPTDCPEREGCFKLRWADGRAYTDPERPPSREEVLQASLSEGEDSWWVTFSGIGVQKNDYYTWGVCLPDREPEGMYYALAVFHSLRALALDVPRILH